MQPIATFTKFHGKGNIEVIMNNVVNRELTHQREAEQKALETERAFLWQEFQKANKKHELEMKGMNVCMNTIKNQRNKMLAEKLKAIEDELYNKSFIDKAKEVFFFCFACILVLLMWAKFIEYGYYDENGKWHKISNT